MQGQRPDAGAAALKTHGDHTFNDLIKRLCCEKCGNHPAPVYLCASHFRTGHGIATAADWAIELVSPPTERPWH